MTAKQSNAGRLVGAALAVAIMGAPLVSPAAAHQAGKPPAPAGETVTTGHMSGGHMSGPAGESMRQHMVAMPGMENLMMPPMNPARGRKLFVEKGCVACHSINGVGGDDATALDAHSMPKVMNPFDFAAKMWRMAPFMIAAQEEELGEQILFTGEELADIIAFVHDDEEQHRFSEADLTPAARKMMHHHNGEVGAGAAAHEEEPGHHHLEGQPESAAHGHLPTE